MYILKENLQDYTNLSKVTEFGSIEDISTFIDTFERVREEKGYENIVDVVQDSNGFYYFVIDGGSGDFNIFEFINSIGTFGIDVSCINAKLVFPRRLSRGINILSKDTDEDVSTSYLDEEDLPTGFLDDSDRVEYTLVRSSDGSRVTIPFNGMKMGRKSSEVDYVIKGNTNVGRVHCELYYAGSVLKVHDFKSLNGTFVNNKKVSFDSDCELNVGDILTLAEERFTIAL